MNRRSFFQSLGAAVLGTAIALKLPDNLVPKTPILKVSDNDNYAFGYTGYDGDGKQIAGRILAQINLQAKMPRVSRIIYIENC